MNVSYYNYRKMNEYLRTDIRHELEILLSLDSDEELFEYQYKNEKKIGKMLNRGYAKGVSCGTAALQFSLIAMGIGAGDEVITTPHTYIATALAISNTGAKPVFVDIDKVTMLIDINKIEAAITKNTKAIIPVHLNGLMVDMKRIRSIAKKHGLKVIEDACQSHHALSNGKQAGTYSDSVCYSFFPNKPLGGISNGGMVITKSRKIRNDIEALRNPTSDNPIVLKSFRTPAYLDWDQIAFILGKMKYSNGWVKRRRAVAAKYSNGLKGLPLVLPVEPKNSYHVWRDYAIRTDSKKIRDRLMKYLMKKGIKTVIHYKSPIHLTKTYAHLGYKFGDFPNAENACDTLISLPNNSFLSDSEIDYTINILKQFFRK